MTKKPTARLTVAVLTAALSGQAAAVLTADQIDTIFAY